MTDSNGDTIGVPKFDYHPYLQSAGDTSNYFLLGFLLVLLIGHVVMKNK